MRKLMLTGHIVNNAEVKVTQNGNKFLSFRLANNDKYSNTDEEKTYWFSVMSFNSNLIALQSYLTKGKPIIVTGRWSDRVYESKVSGGCEIGRDIFAESIDFISDGTQNPNGETAPTTTPVNKEVPKTQTEFKAPTTAELQVPTPKPTAAAIVEDDDDLPF